MKSLRSGSDKVPCTKIHKPLVVYIFWKCYEMMSITIPGIYGKILIFLHKKCDFKVILIAYDTELQISFWVNWVFKQPD